MEQNRKTATQTGRGFAEADVGFDLYLKILTLFGPQDYDLTIKDQEDRGRYWDQSVLSAAVDHRLAHLIPEIGRTGRVHVDDQAPSA